MSLRHFLLPLLLTFGLAACGSGETDEHAHAEGDDHDEQTEAEPAKGKGAHNGRMLTQGPYSVELAIYEDGVPPEYRAWLYKDGEPLPPTAGELTVVLTRLGDITDTHAFTPKDDYLLGSLEVYEPHSFDVAVTARIDGQTLSWSFPSYEGRTTIPAPVAKDAGIEIAAAGPGVIRDEHDVQGLLTPIEGRHARIVARFPGPVKAVRVGLGDTVRAGQALATVESNVSLSDYAVTAPLAGTVLARNVAVGDLAGEQPLFEIADLSALWVDLHLFGADAQHITPGLPVEVTRLSDGVSARTTLDRVLPGTATASQSTVARATVDNADGRWRPGAAVRARVTVAEQTVDLMVPLAALQRFRDWDVVFVRFGDDYEIRPLELGRRDGVNVEVLSGLKAGDPVVVAQSYIVKADIEKSGASHDH
jgi:cobalt-zinc-cadmium efflux system membrane fusion protein